MKPFHTAPLRRPLALAALLTALWPAAPAVAAEPGYYSFVPLIDTTGDFNETQAQSVNELGEVGGLVGIRAPDGGYSTYGATWGIDGSIHKLPVRGMGNRGVWLWSLNDAGLSAGYFETNYHSMPIAWFNGSVIPLHGLRKVNEGRAMGVNNRGQIVGTSDTRIDNPPSRQTRPVIWQGSTEARDLGTPAGWLCGGARDINNHGLIAGYLCDDGWEWHPYDVRHAALWRDGVVQDLGTLGGTDSLAIAVNDAGVVIGNSTVPSDGKKPLRHGFVWRGNQMQALDGPDNAYPLALNEHGDIIGTFYTFKNGNQPVGWFKGKFFRLDKLLSPETLALWRIDTATGINNAGVIVGNAWGYVNGSYKRVGYALIPPAGAQR